MKKIAYTAVFGSYDTPRTPSVISDGWEYICFTDTPKPVEGWKMVYAERGDTTRQSILISRYHKIVFQDHVDCNICLWTDANIQIRCDLNEFARQYKEYELVTMRHPKRVSIYSEAKACLHQTEQLLIKQQMEQYVSEHYFADNGLISSGILLRRNNKNVRSFCDKWFAELEKYSIRDQLSFNYVLWKHPLKLGLVEYRDLLAKEFDIRPHKPWR